MFFEVYLHFFCTKKQQQKTNKYVEKLFFLTLILNLFLKWPVFKGRVFKASQLSATVMIG